MLVDVACQVLVRVALARCWFMGSSQCLSGAGSWVAHGTCQVSVGVVARSACQAWALVSAQRSPVLVRH